MKKLKVLIVDDEKELLYIMKSILGDLYDVDTASNGIEALHILEDNQYDLIITDINMPRMDGNALIKNIRERNILTDIIVISGNSVHLPNEVKAKFQKPLDVVKLIKKINELKDTKEKKMEMIGNICPHCNDGVLTLMRENFPYTIDHLSCSSCSSTYNLKYKPLMLEDVNGIASEVCDLVSEKLIVNHDINISNPKEDDLFDLICNFLDGYSTGDYRNHN
jgi:CheY-like chemotaxis protein